MAQHAAHISSRTSSINEAPRSLVSRSSKNSPARAGSHHRASKAFGKSKSLAFLKQSSRRVELRKQLVVCSEDFVTDDTPLITVDLDTDENGAFTVDGTLRLTDVEPRSMYALLTDHSSSSRVFRNIVETEELERDGGRVLLQQKCLWEFLIFSGTFNITLEVVENDETQQFSFGITESSFMRRMEGSWEVQPDGEHGAIVQHHFTVQPALSAPPPFGSYTGSIFRSQVEGILEDLNAEVQRCRGKSLDASSPPGTHLVFVDGSRQYEEELEKVYP
ncbi:hypothetical protein CYMTET_10976 [Cymbomonas tetramitiformis]|uniref:Coenzyme Q-binding protein COQ10 START domain-containing protein n=1 Tax=Cymbomonas tetramitiformis TaxID=36881 RepID=A0AAE0LDA1_9CHLO|nr:hypothetical protein CYMTET_10976 [Cymbomonas tetramitiformis]